MVDKKVTTLMVLEVDLQCHRCVKKVKKVLGKFPQIRDQVFDEKQNIVTIKVICCSPEKIKQKIICKAGESVKSIEIKVPENPESKSSSHDHDNEDEKEKATQPEAEAEPEPKSPEQDTNTTTAGDQHRTCCVECYQGRVVGPCFLGYGGDGYYQPRTCCSECYGGRAGGPCFHGYAGTSWPSHHPGYGYKPVCDEFYVVQCPQENSGTCTIM